MTEMIETSARAPLERRRLLTLIVAELMLDGLEGNAGRIADYFEGRGAFGPGRAAPGAGGQDPALIETARRIARDAGAGDRAVRSQI